MKYVTPKYESILIATKDVVTASTSAQKYEVEQNNDGSGNVIMRALDLFK